VKQTDQLRITQAPRPDSRLPEPLDQLGAPDVERLARIWLIQR
jgi:hypothetical protein